MNRRRFEGLCAFVALAVLLAAGPAAAQETGTLQGRVTDAITNQPLTGVQVFIANTPHGTVTNAEGRYLLLNVPAGSHLIQAQFVGYGQLSREVTVTAGQTTTLNLMLESEAYQLGEIVVTGVSGGAMERAKVPFSVARVSADQMPVQAVNPLSQLQGRVPGATISAISGRPGAEPSLLLRGPRSINASGRDQGPLYIVDGVVLASGLGDLNPADIESIEVVKGAAASTLYGSRAASGVIAITTRRGNHDGVRFSVRTEYGINNIERDFGIARNHPYMLDETGERFCVMDPVGNNLCTRTIDYRAEMARINNTPDDFAATPPSFPIDPGAATSGRLLRHSFLAGQYSGKTYNAVEQLVDPKPLAQTTFNVSGRAGSTSFFSSFGHTREGGAIMGLDGYERFTARLNLDQRIGNDWSVDVRSFVSRATHDGSHQEEGGQGFFRLTRTPAIADITQRDQYGRLFIRTNLGSAGVQNENPLYSFDAVRREDTRWRVMAGAKVRYMPSTWVEVDADFNVDRLNLNFLQFRNKGYRTTNSAPETSEGLIFNGVNNRQSINTSAGMYLRPNLLDNIGTNFQLRWLYEHDATDNRSLQGNRLRVQGVTAAANATNLQNISSSNTERRMMSVSGGATFDIMDRYTVDLALRQDGYSLFGSEQRWQTYGRASAAWLVANEDWFPVDALSMFTLRASYGTAGRAPRFSAQYETYSIGSGGALSASTLGNRNLRPEVNTEIELGAEFELFNRWGASVTYSNALIDDQILPVPVSASTGFNQQWQNAGAMRSKTLEAALTLPFVQGQDFTWSATATYARNRSIVERLDVPPFFMGTNLQGTAELLRIAEGERYGMIYGAKFMRSCSDLPSEFQSKCGTPTSAFQTNSDGYLVWVGEGNNPGMGISDNLWNVQAPASETPWGDAGVVMNWGMPILIRDASGSPELLPLGSALPDYQLGMAHTFTYKNFSLYGMVEGSFGRHVWNQGRHWAHLDFLSADIDQANRSIHDAKPIGYYYRRGGGPGGSTGVGGFYDALAPNSHFVEDASYVKLRELQASYHFGRIMGYGDWTLSLVGRNLKTWTDYSGFDPEVGAGNSGGGSGSGIINAIDAFTFPSLRSISFVVSATF